MSDNGAVFRAVVSNLAGNATSNISTLTVTASAIPPTVTVTSEPVNVSVAAGAAASFSVEGSCSASTFTVQWQRASGSAVFADIAGATATTYTLNPSLNDSGAQFRALLSCSGTATTASNVASLVVTGVTVNTLSAVPVTGVRDQALIQAPNGIVREPSGSFAFISATTIRRLSADLSTITLVAGDPNASGSADGVGAAALFSGPSSITADMVGNLYVTEPGTNVIRRIAADTTVTTIAGTPYSAGSTDGAGAAARFHTPRAIASGPDGDLYIADTDNAAVRRMTTAGVVTTYAGDVGNSGFTDGQALNARFSLPWGVAVGGNGIVYVSDYGNRRIRRILRSGNMAGNVETLAGSGASTPAASIVDGPALAAGFQTPRGLSVDGNLLYVRDADSYSGLIRAVNLTTGAVTTVAGTRGPNPINSTTALIDGPLGTAFLSYFDSGIAPIGDGRLLFTDLYNKALRVVGNDGNVTTIAHNEAFTLTDGNGVLAQLPPNLTTLAAIGAAADGSLFLAEESTIRRLAADGTVTPIVGMPGYGGNLDGSNTIAHLMHGGQAIAVAPDDTVYFFDSYDIRRLNPITHTVVSFAGSKTAQGAVDGPPAVARFQNVQGLAVGPGGDVFAADGFNAAIRRIDAAGNVTTFAGALGVSGTADGPAGVARFTQPRALAFAPDGSLWVVDDASPYATLRRIAPDGTVTTLATSGAFLNRGGTNLAIDPAGNAYIANIDGLFALATDTGVLTLLIPSAPSAIVYGPSPQLTQGVSTLVVVGVKQLVMINEGVLVRAVLR
ncbi:MAG: NHL repeat-containing protein [Rhodoferax sp.]|uniref:NHL repeat-containing protein n=1 Tax=Rhodoferax sp. TaxID=50421 RepID=UPI003263A9ED